MQYITNSKFINNYLNDYNDIDELINYFNIIKLLIKKYWLKVVSQEFISKISIVDTKLVDFIKLLDLVWKLNLKTINEITRLIKNKRIDYTKTFVLKWQSVNNLESKVDNIIKSKLNKSQVSVVDSNSLWLEVNWEWMYYKRNIDDDLNKLLK